MSASRRGVASTRHRQCLSGSEGFREAPFPSFDQLSSIHASRHVPEHTVCSGTPGCSCRPAVSSNVPGFRAVFHCSKLGQRGTGNELETGNDSTTSALKHLGNISEDQSSKGHTWWASCCRMPEPVPITNSTSPCIGSARKKDFVLRAANTSAVAENAHQQHPGTYTRNVVYREVIAGG